MSDLIERQAAIDALSTPHGVLYPIRTVEELPSAESKTGKWIFQRYYTWACSECGANPTKGMGYVQRKEELFNYCPNCGARMDAERKEE